VRLRRSPWRFLLGLPLCTRVGAIVLTAGLFLLVSCSSAASSRRESPETAIDAVDTIEAFWLAAASGDSIGMAALSVSDAPVLWARDWEQAFPRFFRQTHGQIKVIRNALDREDRSLLVQIIEVPFVSCPIPAHSGVPDRYVVTLRRDSARWRIVKVFRPIC